MFLQTWPAAVHEPGPVQGVYLSLQKWPCWLQICAGQQSLAVSQARTTWAWLQTAGVWPLSQIQLASPLCWSLQSWSFEQPETKVESPLQAVRPAAARRAAKKSPRRAKDGDV